MFQEENFAERLSKDVSYNVNRAGKTFSCPWSLNHWLSKKRTVSMGENSCKFNYFVDGKNSTKNSNTPDLHIFS